MQKDAFKKADVGKVFSDTSSGAKAERPGLNQALDFLREGDTLVVRKLDRLGRSLKDLIAWMATMQERNIGFRSLTENIDTTSPGGKLIFHIFGALAELERDLIRERTKAGLQAARARGRKDGRKQKLDARKAQIAQQLYASRTHTIKDICTILGVSRATLYRSIKTEKHPNHTGSESVE